MKHFLKFKLIVTFCLFIVIFSNCKKDNNQTDVYGILLNDSISSYSGENGQ